LLWVRKVPRLINYLNRLVPGRTYDEFDLERLQLVYENVCDALAVPVGDPRRETVARLLFDLDGNTSKTEELVTLIVAAFRQMA
jgi:hypothetical protein